MYNITLQKNQMSSFNSSLPQRRERDDNDDNDNHQKEASTFILTRKNLEAKILQDLENVKTLQNNDDNSDEEKSHEQQEAKRILLQTKNSKELVHLYNQTKDIAQGLLGIIAQRKGVMISEVYEEYDLDVKED